MHPLFRIGQRIIMTAIGLTILWFVITHIFIPIDKQVPVFIAILLTYIITAYLCLPQIIHISLYILRKGRIPRFTHAADGLPADPVNIIVLGSESSLRNAFEKAQWYVADKLSIRTAFKIDKTFIQNKPYPTAPFSRLFLFGRKQDIGFEQPIGPSPRQRHHVRFWMTHTDHIPNFFDTSYWTRKQPKETDRTGPVMWVGAATKDIGFGLAALTYQITHKVDSHVDEERGYILHALQNTGCVKHVTYYESGAFTIGKYTSDGKVMVVELIEG